MPQWHFSSKEQVSCNRVVKYQRIGQAGRSWVLSGRPVSTKRQTPPWLWQVGLLGGSVRAAKGRLCDGTKWCSVGHGQTVCTLLASKGKRHWHWLIFLTLLNMKRVVGSLEWRGFGSPIRWATPVVCTEHGPLKCTLTFIRISLTPIMGEPARLEENCDLQWSQSPQNSFRLGHVSEIKSRIYKCWFYQHTFSLFNRDNIN